MKFFARKIGNVMRPADTESLDAFEKLPGGDKVFMCEATMPRNVKHHRLFWKLCARIGKGIGQEADWVERAFKIETGHFDLYEYGGKEHLVLRPLTFAKVDQIEFATFFEACVQIAYGKWHVPPESINDLLLPQGRE